MPSQCEDVVYCNSSPEVLVALGTKTFQEHLMTYHRLLLIVIAVVADPYRLGFAPFPNSRARYALVPTDPTPTTRCAMSATLGAGRNMCASRIPNR